MIYGENPNIFLELVISHEQKTTQINTTEVNKLDLYFVRATILIYLFLLTF